MGFSTLHCAYRLPGLTETHLWGRTLGASLKAGDVIALIGDLGAGKTTLTQAIARGMQISEPVTSPTFALAQEYAGRMPLFHFDPYRLDTPEAFAEIGFDDYFERGGVMVIEWADKIAPLLPDERLTLTLSIADDGETDGSEEAPRAVEAQAVGERYVTLLKDLNAQSGIAALLRLPV
ncbi:MAG: tsaE [Chthonomonadaceae bacterium]|nr:tsaE [Chthonomonadaceae bacterium]